MAKTKDKASSKKSRSKKTRSSKRSRSSEITREDIEATKNRQPAESNTSDIDGKRVSTAQSPHGSTPSNTLAKSPLKKGESGPQGSLDSALTDPDFAKAGKEGRTSDAANRAAGVVAAEVPPDLSEGAKASDAGAEQYPFPPGGDVEIATVNPGKGKNEKMAPLDAETWVILDGSHELVPDRLDGARAVVTNAPTILCNCDWAPRTHEHPHPDAAITVRTRDEANATLTLPLEAFKHIDRGARGAALTRG